MVFTNTTIDILDTFPDGFSFSSTLTVRYMSRNAKICYFPVPYNHRTKGSKFISGKQLSAIAGLALRLTLERHPVKFPLQLIVPGLAAFLLAGMVGGFIGGGPMIKALLAFLFAPFTLVLFLAYIYVTGRRVK